MAHESRPAATSCETAKDYQRAGIRSASHSTSDASPDTAVQLSRVETILDSILRSLAGLAGAQ